MLLSWKYFTPSFSYDLGFIEAIVVKSFQGETWNNVFSLEKEKESCLSKIFSFTENRNKVVASIIAKGWWTELQRERRNMRPPTKVPFETGLLQIEIWVVQDRRYQSCRQIGFQVSLQSFFAPVFDNIFLFMIFPHQIFLVFREFAPPPTITTAVIPVDLDGTFVTLTRLEVFMAITVSGLRADGSEKSGKHWQKLFRGSSSANFSATFHELVYTIVDFVGEWCFEKVHDETLYKDKNNLLCQLLSDEKLHL